MPGKVKLTNAQSEALIKLRDHGPRSAYPGISLGTLQSLAKRGLVNATYGLGSMAMPPPNPNRPILANTRKSFR